MKKSQKNGSGPAPVVGGLTVYGADWCPDVRRSRKTLESAGIDYIYVNVDHDKSASTLVRRLQGGKRRIPTLVWPDNTFLVEPTNDQLSERLMRQAEA